MTERVRWGPEPPATGWQDVVQELKGAYSRRTLYSFVYHFRAFELWCDARGEIPLPASDAAVAAHIDDIYPELTGTTVRSRIWAIRALHKLLDLPDPTRGRRLQFALKRGLRLHGRRITQAIPLSFEDKERVLAAAAPTIEGLRDRLIVALAYDTLCRPIELIALRIEDIRYLENGTARVQVRHAKNDQLGEGGAAYISEPTVALLKTWLAEAKLEAGPILRQARHGRVRKAPLGRNLPGERLRALAAEAGLPNAERLSGYSPRIGAAQDLAAAGCSLLEIMRAGRWRNPRVVARYTRAAPINVWAAVERTHDASGPVFRHRPVTRPPNRSAWRDET
jgi:integrase